MTTEQVSGMIKEIGIPYAYYQFPEDTSVPTPFICFYFDENNDVFADDVNYTKIVNLCIELYTDDKDFNLEKQVESVLQEHNMSYTKSEARIDSEKMFEILYQMEVIINV